MQIDLSDELYRHPGRAFAHRFSRQIARNHIASGISGGDTAGQSSQSQGHVVGNRGYIAMNEFEMESQPQQSLLSWMFMSLGPFYGLLIPLVGFALFVGACCVVGLNRRSAVIAAFLVFLPLPLMIGLFASVQGLIASFSIIATAGATPKPSEMAVGISTALFATLVGLLATFPSYFVLAFGLFFRTLFEKPSAK